MDEDINVNSATQLAKIPDEKGAVVHESGKLSVLPPPPRLDLSNAKDVRREMAAVYRSVKEGKLDGGDGSKLVYMLREIGQLIRTDEVQQRIEALERAINFRKVNSK